MLFVCLLQFFGDVVQNSASLPCSEKSPSILGLWPAWPVINLHYSHSLHNSQWTTCVLCIRHCTSAKQFASVKCLQSGITCHVKPTCNTLPPIKARGPLSPGQFGPQGKAERWTHRNGHKDKLFCHNPSLRMYICMRKDRRAVGILIYCSHVTVGRNFAVDGSPSTQRLHTTTICGQQVFAKQ